MRTTRCKMLVYEITENAWSKTQKRVKLITQYDQTIPEDQRFFSSTPQGEMTILVDNPAALEGLLKLGNYVYLDIATVGDSAADTLAEAAGHPDTEPSPMMPTGEETPAS